MNAIDFLIIILLGVGTIIGFFHGLVRTTAHMLALYFVTIVAAFAYPTMSRALRYMAPDSNEQLRAVAGFLLVFLVLFITVFFSIRPTFKKRRDSFIVPGSVDRLAGLVAGFFLTGLFIGLAFLLSDFLLSVSWVKWEPLRGSVAQLVHSSPLGSMVRGLLPYAVLTLKPWFAPIGGLPRLFDIR